MRIAWSCAISVCLLAGCANAPLSQQPDETTYNALAIATSMITRQALGAPCQQPVVPPEYLTACPLAPPNATPAELQVLLKKCVAQSTALILVTKLGAMLCPTMPIASVK